MKTIPSMLVVFFLVSVTSLRAEVYPLHEPCQGYAVYHRASTFEEGLARGLADLTRSAGLANRLHSAAAKNWEEARRLNLENRVYGTQVYFDMRSLNREARQAQRGPRPTQDDLARYARIRAPQRLSVSELDPFTGQIEWPPLLQEPTYANACDLLDSICKTRTQAGSLTSVDRAHARWAVDRLQQQLRNNIRVHSPQDYAQAKQFMDRLAHELRGSAQVDVPLGSPVASRDAGGETRY